jgi:hypothetical protein
MFHRNEIFIHFALNICNFEDVIERPKVMVDDHMFIYVNRLLSFSRCNFRKLENMHLISSNIVEKCIYVY